MKIRFPSCWQQYEVVAAMATIQFSLSFQIAVHEWISWVFPPETETETATETETETESKPVVFGAFGF